VKEKSLFDEELDNRIELMHDKDGLSVMETVTSIEIMDDDDGAFERSVRAFAAAHQGAGPEKPTDLLPFVDAQIAKYIAESAAQHPSTPEEQRRFQKHAAELLSRPAAP